MQKHEQGEAKVIPIILNHCDWTDTPFSKLNALPRKGTPIADYDNKDKAWNEIVQALKKVLESDTKDTPFIKEESSNNPLPNNDINTDIGCEFQRQLDIERNTRNCYQPQTALERLERIEEAIRDSSLPANEKKKYLAESYFLKGLSYSDIEDKDSSNKYLKKAYKTNPNKEEYKPFVALLYLREDKYDLALQLANEILDVNENDIRANFVKKTVDKNFDVDVHIQEEKFYKSLYLGSIRTLSPNELIEKAKIILNTEFATIPKIPSSINIDELSYWINLTGIFIENILLTHPNNNLLLKHSAYKENEHLKYCLTIYQTIMTSVHSESHSLQWYVRIEFLSLYVSYLLTQDISSVLNMYVLFKQKMLDSPFEQKQYFLQITDICLKQVGETQKSIELNELFQTNNKLINQAINYGNQNDFDKSVLEWKKYFESKELFLEVDLQYMVMLVYAAREAKEDTEQLFNAFFSKKPFENYLTESCVKIACFSTYQARREEVLGLLNEVEAYLTTDNDYQNVKWYLCLSYFEIQEYGKVIEKLPIYYPKYRENFAHLSLIIETCIRNNQDSLLLMELLEYWRRHNYQINEHFINQEIHIYSLLDLFPK